MGALAFCAFCLSLPTPTAPPPTDRHRVGASSKLAATLNDSDIAADDVVNDDTDVVDDTAANDIAANDVVNDETDVVNDDTNVVDDTAANGTAANNVVNDDTDVVNDTDAEQLLGSDVEQLLGNNVVNDTAANDVEQPLGNDTCLVTVGVGYPFSRIARVLGRSKKLYADKWGYRNYVYHASNYGSYVHWCSKTQFGKPVHASSWDKFHIHPVMKFCAMAHAMAERDCNYVFWTDGDGVIVDWNTRLSFDWPGSVKSSDGKPWLLAALAGFPQGSRFKNKYRGHSGAGLGSRLSTEKGAEFCQAADSCTDFYKFYSCLNSGAMLMRRSSEAFEIMSGAFFTSALGLEHRLEKCSTAAMNPWGFEQCHAGGDQCGIGCSLRQMQKDKHKHGHRMPDGISCVSMAVDQRLQEVMSPAWLNEHLEVETGRLPSENALVVNPIGNFDRGSPQNKGKVLDWLLSYYPNMREFSDGLNHSDRKWLVDVR